MRFSRFKRPVTFFIRRYATEVAEKKVIKYTDTINLPKTKMPVRLSAAKRKEVQELINNQHLTQLYNWQRENLEGPDFILHDGPPYANGDTHVGHAVNKILKDIILKGNIMKGRRVDYKPGWDCHGLPIELKALNDSLKAPPLEVRKKARAFALEALERQKSDFQSWGVTGAWSENIYRTIDADYIKNQLNIFYKMYEKGLIYRDLKPVHWSPSSKTALAEAELEYDNNFTSASLFVRFKLNKVPEVLQSFSPLFILVWTTTPWTLPSNQAVCFNPSLQYCVANHSGTNYIIAKNLIEQFSKETSLSMEIMSEFDGNILSEARYQHPILNLDCPFLPGSHVQDSKGTGLVHTAPAHGMDDFLICLANKIPAKCFVDESACYSKEAPEFLQNKFVLTDGNDAVLQYLDENVVWLGQIQHAYPIDWRTKKPVIFRASKQWFIDTAKIKDKAVEEANTINLYPMAAADVNRTALITQLTKRPYWCISRQRVWGVPIPVFYTDENVPVINDEIIKKICDVVTETGNIDFWWSSDSKEILPPSVSEKFGSNLRKGSDILDIWFDSGTSWYCALGGDKTADMYLEGVDQFTGWFQSSLLTSIAVQEKSPYHAIFVHGFTVDEKGHKMSKSLGNVIAPNDIIDKYGIDTMRWWIAAHSAQHSAIPVSKNILESSAETVQKIRATLKYMNGVLGEKSPEENSKTHQEYRFNAVDNYMFHALLKFHESIRIYNNFYMFNYITTTINNFITNEVSAFYLHIAKDRLYCGNLNEYQAVRKTIEHVYTVICKTIWPITPFLVEESWSYFDSSQSFYITKPVVDWKEWQDWANQDLFDFIQVMLEIKHDLFKNIKDVNSLLLDAKIYVNDDIYKRLNRIHKLYHHATEATLRADLLEIFQVGSLTIDKCESLNEENRWRIEINKTERILCPRCRRYEVQDLSKICSRCQKVLLEKSLKSVLI